MDISGDAEAPLTVPSQAIHEVAKRLEFEEESFSTFRNEDDADTPPACSVESLLSGKWQF